MILSMLWGNRDLHKLLICLSIGVETESVEISLQFQCPQERQTCLPDV